MAQNSRRLETAANAAIIVAALLVIGIAVKQYLLPSATPQRRQIQAGERLAVPNFDWAAKPTHLVLVLSNNCHYCSESAPFYRRLVRESSQRNDLGLVALLPQAAPEADAYLRQLDLAVPVVSGVAFKQIPIAATPTLLLVDSKGQVRNVWLGKLPPAGEAEVMQKIGCTNDCSS